MSKRVTAEVCRKWLMLIPVAVGLMWFFVLQAVEPAPKYLIYSPMDDYIPFLPVFIIPYVSWYFYVIGTGVFLFRYDTGGFVRFAAYLAGGMLTACAIFTFIPNGQALRPELSGADGPLINIVRLLYSVDPPVNTSPSIHVTYSLGTHLAIALHCRRSNRPRLIAAASCVLATFIILSTVFVKQHSILCIAAGFALFSALTAAIYRREILNGIRGKRIAIKK